MDSGSVLGAVKTGLFLPWDIDGDIYYNTRDFEIFKHGKGASCIELDMNVTDFCASAGTGREKLEAAGIELSGFSRDNYSDRGATSFKLHFRGMIVEMMGKRDLDQLATGQLDPWTNRHTRVNVGGVWVRTHFHPGRYARCAMLCLAFVLATIVICRYCRSRYGPNYLKHAQSWRYNEGQSDSFASYQSAEWNLCEDPGFHECLEHYPNDGNLIFNRENFDEWKGDLK